MTFPSASDITKATENVKKAQGTQCARRFTATQRLVFQQTGAEVTSHTNEFCHDRPAFVKAAIESDLIVRSDL